MHEVDAVEFETLVETSDIISLHARLMDSTRHMFDLETFRTMKPGAILVNTARGALIDEAALAEALDKGYLAGAAIDVTESEPVSPDSPLLKMDNVIITPHAAWYTEESQDALQRMAAEEMARVLSGEMPLNLVNKGVLAQNKKPSGRGLNNKRRADS
jgi:D-3-phosphoglycerate dehydrogenase